MAQASAMISRLTVSGTHARPDSSGSIAETGPDSTWLRRKLSARLRWHRATNRAASCSHTSSSSGIGLAPVLDGRAVPTDGRHDAMTSCCWARKPRISWK